MKGRDHETPLAQRGRKIANRQTIDLGSSEPWRGSDGSKFESAFDARLNHLVVQKQSFQRSAKSSLPLGGAPGNRIVMPGSRLPKTIDEHMRVARGLIGEIVWRPRGVVDVGRKAVPAHFVAGIVDNEIERLFAARRG